MTVPKKKNQHYVPRVLLRRFSRDGATISLFVVSSRKLINGAPLKHQCAAAFFYGANGNIESMFSNLESQFAGILRRAMKHPEWNPSREDDQILKLFIAYQRQRTHAAAQGANERLNAFVKYVAQFAPGLAGLESDSLRFEYSNPAVFTTQVAASTFPLLLDLRIKLIINAKRVPFITSDNPVIAYNQFAESEPNLSRCMGTQGLSAKGLQLFLPVSPELAIHLYDGSTYSVGSPRGHICTPGARDVRLLNTLQAINACGFRQLWHRFSGNSGTGWSRLMAGEGLGISGGRSVQHDQPSFV